MTAFKLNDPCDENNPPARLYSLRIAAFSCSKGRSMQTKDFHPHQRCKPVPLIRNQNIKVLFSAQEIAARNKVLAQEITQKCHENLLIVAILKGSFMFVADLLRELHHAGLSPEIEFLSLSSYGAGTRSSGKVRIVRDIESDVSGRNVLLIDDILESGHTAAFAKNLLLDRGAKSVEIAVLLDKKEKRALDIEADYAGFACPDYFVVGYGIDKAHTFRELPFVGAVEED